MSEWLGEALIEAGVVRPSLRLASQAPA